MDLPLSGFIDSDEEDVGPTEREQRINRAFQNSKESYKNETVSLDCFWFGCKPEDIPTLPSQLLGFHSLDASVQAAYQKKDYQLVLSLCLAYLDGVRDGHIIITGNCAAREKELLDIAIKSAIRIGSEEQAYSLALRALPHSTLAASIAEAFIFSNHPRDAISVLLRLSSVRSREHPFVGLLSRAFTTWEQQLSESGREHGNLDVASVHTLQTILEGLVQRTAYFSRPLFPDNGSSFRVSVHTQPARVKVDEEELRQLCSGAKLEEAEFCRLVQLLTSREVAEYQGDSNYRSARTM